MGTSTYLGKPKPAPKNFWEGLRESGGCERVAWQKQLHESTCKPRDAFWTVSMHRKAIRCVEFYILLMSYNDFWQLLESIKIILFLFEFFQNFFALKKFVFYWIFNVKRNWFEIFARNKLLASFQINSYCFGFYTTKIYTCMKKMGIYVEFKTKRVTKLRVKILNSTYKNRYRNGLFICFWFVCLFVSNLFIYLVYLIVFKSLFFFFFSFLYYI